jgi:hypothetical protein
MNNDLLYSFVLIIVVLILIGIIYYWIRSSNQSAKGNTSSTPSSSGNSPGSLSGGATSGKLNSSLYTGILKSSQLNQRCSDGTGANINLSVLLPGYEIPQKCDEDYVCVKVDPVNDPYGYCKAKIGTKCFTVFDCAPAQPALGPTGVFPTQEVYCNNICFTGISGNVLQGCTVDHVKNASGLLDFACDSNQNLVCNNVTKVPNGSCFTKYLQPCETNADCLGGICFGKNDDPTNTVCYCPSKDSNVNLQICVYVDGEKCKYNDECYGGVCIKDIGSDNGICQSRYLPGKPCKIDANNQDVCLEGYGCAISDQFVGRICQPLVREGPTGVSIPAVTGKVNSLCTDYNTYTGIGPDGPIVPDDMLPLLNCDSGLVCNYNFSSRVPMGSINVDYLKGMGICQRPFSKINQSCSQSSACAYPAICIVDNNGQGVCSRPQYFNENETYTVYVADPLSEATGINFFNNDPNIYNQDRNTLMVQLVGGGGGGQYSLLGPTGLFGGGGGGSGNILGYIPADPFNFTTVPLGETGTFVYKNTNGDGIYPNPYIIDLESFSWDSIKVTLGAGGTGGYIDILKNPISGATGGSTTLEFSYLSTVVESLSVSGGGPGNPPGGSPITENGSGGTGYNGGGAGSGGINSTLVALGGAGDLTNGGQRGFSTKGFKANSGRSGYGGGIGGGDGLEHLYPLISGKSSGGGGGGGGSSVLYFENNIAVQSGGNGAVSTIINNVPFEIIGFSGVKYTGGGGGGGGGVSTDGSIVNYTPSPAGSGGNGYAILQFSKVYKDINYAGVENPNVVAPPSGSSGVCTEGYVSNGLYQIDKNGAPFCIPKQNYTCNNFNQNNSKGSLCMNSASTSTSGNCSDKSIGIFIPIPANLTAPRGSVVTQSFGKWHFIDLPDQDDPTSAFNIKSGLSVWQEPDISFYPNTNLIYHPYNDASNDQAKVSTFFYYAYFSTVNISPNSPANTLKIAPQWFKVLIQPSSSTHTLNSVADIKFSTAGNIVMVVNETAPIVLPFNAGNDNSGGTPLPYNIIYSSDIETQLYVNFSDSTGTLTYTISTNGPPIVNSVDNVPCNTENEFNNLIINTPRLNPPFDNFVWTVDDLYNNSVCFLYKTPASNDGYSIASQDFTNSVNEVTQFNYVYQNQYFPDPNGKFRGLPRSLNFYTASISATPNYYRYLWDSYESNNKNMISFYNNNTPVNPNNPDNLTFYLEEMYPEQSITFSFSRLLNLEFFDFYYVSKNDQYKYVSVNTKFNAQPIASATTTFNRNELQVDGYLPTLLNQDTSQTIFKILSMGNIDRSLYALVETCK